MAKYYRIDAESKVIYANCVELFKDENKKELERVRTLLVDKEFILKNGKITKAVERVNTRVSGDVIKEYVKQLDGENSERYQKLLEIEKAKEYTFKNGNKKSTAKGKALISVWFKDMYPDEYDSLLSDKAKASKEKKEKTELNAEQLETIKKALEAKKNS